jgi:hypothetical protein
MTLKCFAKYITKAEGTSENMQFRSNYKLKKSTFSFIDETHAVYDSQPNDIEVAS